MQGEIRNSIDYPLYVNWIEQGPARDKLGMTLAPGVNAESSFGFRWERDLAVDLRHLRDIHKADYLVSLMEDFEYGQYGMDDFFRSARDAGIKVMHFSIVDVGVPEDWEENRYVGMILDIKNALERNEKVVLHCRGGLGRTGTVAACTLVTFGYKAEEAIRITRDSRPGAIQTLEQERYVRSFERRALWNR
ncbi:cyclin-dependent kinase inhibitor 3 family protein [Rubrobacter radiotolerans]|uniref:Cyclin-dependent kinase inhibitor 3 family protein n=1 Tax=Rubrobacter radiotolerans TaxID=42256 RepID=A0AB35T236_RUBRA|nr:cyclin-dependent kinase inhibitor 3 family protein [Rubrobacter radiotolerans]MDX5893804.1 cyclin-dependent kinase inhibitor 3 family protein [Rubrobacter radiotolerans]SMC04536.1 Dual specificity phosphatase, catalytic domain [Rubrobacter radiotolerans DSM 5868]